MTYVQMTNSAIYDVDESYVDVIAAMDGPDLVELHTDGEAFTVRAVNVVATATNLATLLQAVAPTPMPHE